MAFVFVIELQIFLRMERKFLGEKVQCVPFLQKLFCAHHSNNKVINPQGLSILTFLFVMNYHCEKKIDLSTQLSNFLHTLFITAFLCLLKTMVSKWMAVAVVLEMASGHWEEVAATAIQVHSILRPTHIAVHHLQGAGWTQHWEECGSDDASVKMSLVVGNMEVEEVQGSDKRFLQALSTG